MSHPRKPARRISEPVGRCRGGQHGLLQFLTRSAAKDGGQRDLGPAAPPATFTCDVCGYWHYTRKAA